jgi:hypothetical protein
MSATMPRQGGQVQLEQADIYLAWNMAPMAKGGLLCGTIHEMQQLIISAVWEYGYHDAKDYDVSSIICS